MWFNVGQKNLHKMKNSVCRELNIVVKGTIFVQKCEKQRKRSEKTKKNEEKKPESHETFGRQ